MRTTKCFHGKYWTYTPMAIKIQHLKRITYTLSPEIPTHLTGVEPIFNKLPKEY